MFPHKTEGDIYPNPIHYFPEYAAALAQLDFEEGIKRSEEMDKEAAINEAHIMGMIPKYKLTKIHRGKWIANICPDAYVGFKDSWTKTIVDNLYAEMTIDKVDKISNTCIYIKLKEVKKEDEIKEMIVTACLPF